MRPYPARGVQSTRLTFIDYFSPHFGEKNENILRRTAVYSEIVIGDLRGFRRLYDFLARRKASSLTKKKVRNYKFFTKRNGPFSDKETSLWILFGAIVRLDSRVLDNHQNIRKGFLESFVITYWYGYNWSGDQAWSVKKIFLLTNFDYLCCCHSSASLYFIYQNLLWANK